MFYYNAACTFVMVDMQSKAHSAATKFQITSKISIQTAALKKNYSNDTNASDTEWQYKLPCH